LRDARGAIDAWIEAAEHLGQAIPEDTPNSVAEVKETPSSNA